MKNLSYKLKYLIAGIVIGSLLFGNLSSAADLFFQVTQLKTKVILNNVEKPGSDQPGLYKNGSNYVPMAFTYKGTTYVPLRYVSELFNQPIKYFASPDRIFIGQIPDGKFMSPSIIPSVKDAVIEKKPVTIFDTSYDTGYRLRTTTGSGKMSFTLNKKYSLITGFIGIDASSKWDANINVYFDGREVDTMKMFRSEKARAVKWDVSGVDKLEIEIESPDVYYYKDMTISIGDPVIK